MSEQPTLVLSEHQVAVEPGGEATVELRLRSHSPVVDEFQIEVLGPGAAWTTVEPPTLSLFPGAEGQAQVRFRPPRSWVISAGILSVGLRAVSSLEVDRSAVEECDVEIARYYDVAADLRPRTSRGRLRGRHQLRLHSASNTAVEVALGAEEVDGECRLRVRPRRLVLKPGRGGRARVIVRPAHTPLLGPVFENYTFEASAYPEGGAEIKVPGSMRQSALLPRGAVTIALIAAVLLAGIILLPHLVPRLQIGPVGQVTTTTPTPIVATNTPQQVATPTSQPTTASGGQPTSGPATAPPGGGGGGGPARAGTWTAAKPMTVAREQHTATTLPDGRVLVAGGFQVSGGVLSAVSTTELYDPASGSWTAAAAMTAARAAHTATVLPSGKVLVVGGESQAGIALASAELYDPATTHWSSAGQLQTGRYAHAAVELTSGKVLVVGGRASTSGPVASTELYDPATNSWSTGPNLSVGRSDLTATLLDDGRILVAGGDGSASTTTQPLNVVDLIDPQGRAATRAVNMATGRAGHTATLLVDGRVLVTGGTGGSPRAEVYAPALGTWSQAAAPAAARRFHTAVLLPSGQVLVAGGADSAALASAEAYNPTTNTWTPTPNMSATRWEQAMTLLQNGQVLITGGSATASRTAPPQPTAELYSP